MDKVLAVLALMLLIAFVGVLIWFVSRPDLIVICLIVLAMAIYDLWRQLFRIAKQS